MRTSEGKKHFPSGFSSSGFRKFSLTHFPLQGWLQVSMHGYSEWNVNLNGKLSVPVWCWSGKWLIDVAKVLIEKLLSISRRAREKSREKFQRLLKTIKNNFRDSLLGGWLFFYLKWLSSRSFGWRALSPLNCRMIKIDVCIQQFECKRNNRWH